MPEQPAMPKLPLMRPFTGLRPRPENAVDVAAPPYDVVSLKEAAQLAKGKPYSFLHISRPEIGLPEGTDPYAAVVYAAGAENLKKLVEQGILVRDETPAYYAYRLTMGDHQQTGIVGAASVAAYDVNRVRKHELTRPAKEDDRVRQIDAVNAQTGPVLLAHRPDDQLTAVLDQATAGPAAYEVTDGAGVVHALWVIDEAAITARITELFEAMPAIYIADGHHRSAAASRVAAARRRKLDQPHGDELHESFLAVSFPSDQMHILDYNRIVRDLNGMSAQEFLVRLADSFTVTVSASPFKPSKKGQFGMYLEGQWYGLTPTAPLPDDPKAGLDVSVLTDRLLDPILGIKDLRRDARIDFVGGIRGLEGLQERVDHTDWETWAVAFALYPTAMEELMAVAEADEVMPPKSTWFEPKLADGLVSNPLD
ncbi:DUF1015 domain-containing protein [Magnetospira sp. QH-2]|uniref:DUF1015 domain-containing protein n=1 Tax=Magnetospira sp. (strain QH-2) TaxID=1288970 RepID=UPI0003E819EA|nr:DUF1015 family protein [Magnetospira sp. QH-2]CCQ73487.1 Conserved protein of unknown function [Magnetospira sp. QH-2]